MTTLFLLLFYCSFEKILRWSAIDPYDVILFKDKKEALKFLDKKWLKYGSKVNDWKPVKIEKAKRFKEYFIENKVDFI